MEEEPSPCTLVEFPAIIENAEKLRLCIERSGLSKPSLIGNSVSLFLRPEDPFSHPIKGLTSRSTKILIKARVVDGIVIGITPITIANTVSLADFEWLISPNSSVDEVIETFVKDQSPFIDVEKLEAFADKFFEGKLTFPQTMPPPFFSLSSTPQSYAYKQSESKAKAISDKPSEIPKKRQAISTSYIFRYNDKGEFLAYSDIPTRQMSCPTAIPDELISKLTELFERKPIWLIAQILNEINPNHQSLLRKCLPYFCYYCVSGPFRFNHIRYGFDPRVEKSSALYQTFDVRRHKEDISTERIRGPLKLPHEGSNTPSFYQICDFPDSEFQQIYLSGIEDSFDIRYGWYSMETHEKARLLFKKKYTDFFPVEPSQFEQDPTEEVYEDESYDIFDDEEDF